MVQSVLLCAFAALLVGGIVVGAPLLALLAIGLVMFAGYAVWRGAGPRELASMCTEGMGSVAPVLLLFVIIGALTASWRAAGTIPAITCWSASLVSPSTLVVLAFLLCCGMSILTGSSFGASATVGVVCMTIGTAMGCNPALLGGAVLSGSFFGDRCSPMSSSAVLVANLTNTSVDENVRRMARSSMVPLALAIAVYGILGALGAGEANVPDFASAFSIVFDLSWVVVLPVVAVLVLLAAHVSVRTTMLVSLGLACCICVGVQHMGILELARTLVFGYECTMPSISTMVSGGGVVSMLDVFLVVALASTYSGIFRHTDLLCGLKAHIDNLARRTTPFIGVLLTGLVTTFISCDQVVAVMLTNQLCESCERNDSALALDLENSVVILPAIVPWSTSCIGILGFIGAPVAAIGAALFVFLVPAWTLVLSLLTRRDPSFVDGRAAHACGLDERDDTRKWATSKAA